MQSNEFLKKNSVRFSLYLFLAWSTSGQCDKWNKKELVCKWWSERRNKSLEIFESSRIKSEKSHSTKCSIKLRFYSLWPTVVVVVVVVSVWRGAHFYVVALFCSHPDYFAPILSLSLCCSLFRAIDESTIKTTTSKREKNANSLNYDFLWQRGKLMRGSSEISVLVKKKYYYNFTFRLLRQARQLMSHRHALDHFS